MDGASPAQVRAAIGSLQTHRPLWKLRVTCLYYCRFVHSHHTAEDWALFSALRRSGPALGPIVDRRQAEHLLAHLDYEERAITPTLQEWDRWPVH